MKRYNYLLPILLQKIGYCIFFILYKIFVKIQILGRENLKNIDGPIILAPNHTSELDVTALPMVLPFLSSFSPIYFVTNKTEKYKTFGWRSYIYGGLFFSILGGYPVFSGHKNYAIALDNHIKLLRKKRTICIFPEGKRTKDGQFSEARGGLGYLVYVSGATVIPIAIDTFFNLSWIDFLTRKRKIQIKIGNPIKASEVMSPEIRNPQVQDFRNGSQLVLDKVKLMME